LTFYLAGDGELEQVKAIMEKNNLGNHVQLLGWFNTSLQLSALEYVGDFNGTYA
jgi:hypothetical protein